MYVAFRNERTEHIYAYRPHSRSVRGDVRAVVCLFHLEIMMVPAKVLLWSLAHFWDRMGQGYIQSAIRAIST